MQAATNAAAAAGITLSDAATAVPSSPPPVPPDPAASPAGESAAAPAAAAGGAAGSAATVAFVASAGELREALADVEHVVITQHIDLTGIYWSWNRTRSIRVCPLGSLAHVQHVLCGSASTDLLRTHTI